MGFDLARAAWSIHRVVNENMIDEPTEGLAPLIVHQVGDLIAEIARRGVAILLVEQKLSIAMISPLTNRYSGIRFFDFPL